jgi:hypothetical protein
MKINFLFKRVVALFALGLGFLGVVVCLAGVYPVWLLRSRLDVANEKVFAILDQGLSSARDRACNLQGRLKEFKIRTSEIGQKIRDWSTSNANERLVTAVDIQGQIDKLAGHLQTTEQWLEALMESIRGIQHFLELGALVGAPVAPNSLENLIEELGSILRALEGMERSIDGVHDFALQRESESKENRLVRVSKLLGETELATGAIERRLDEPVTWLSQMQTDTQRLKGQTSKCISLIAIGSCWVLAWIGTGQAALCLHGWKNYYRRASSA